MAALPNIGRELCGRVEILRDRELSFLNFLKETRVWTLRKQIYLILCFLQVGAVSLGNPVDTPELGELESPTVLLAKQEIDRAWPAELRPGVIVHIEIVYELMTLDLKHSMGRNV